MMKMLEDQFDEDPDAGGGDEGDEEDDIAARTKCRHFFKLKHSIIRHLCPIGSEWEQPYTVEASGA